MTQIIDAPRNDQEARLRAAMARDAAVVRRRADIESWRTVPASEFADHAPHVPTDRTAKGLRPSALHIFNNECAVTFPQ